MATLRRPESVCMSTSQAGAEIEIGIGTTLNCNHEAPIVTAPTLNAGGNKTGGNRFYGTTVDTCDSLQVTHAVRGCGFDASEDSTGRGTPLVPVGVTIHGTDKTARVASYTDVAGALRARTPGSQENSSTTAVLPVRRSSDAMAFRAAGQDGFAPGDVSPPIASSDGGGAGIPTIAFTCKDYGADATSETAPTLRSMGHDESHANGGGQIAVAIQNATRGKDQNGLGISEDDTMYTLDKGSQHAVAFEARYARNGRGAPSDVVPPLKAQSGETGKGDAAPLVATAFYNEATLKVCEGVCHTLRSRNTDGGVPDGVMTPTMAVRRLTPRECERLQGFPDDWTKLDDKTADRPRYKALGNSMAVPVMAWIGQRIQAVEDIVNGAS